MIAEAVLETTNAGIVDIIGQRVELTQRGRIWRGLCPFHPDRNPSFEVNASKSAWFCNPCGLGGDAITFIQRFHDTDFVGACKILGLEGDRVSREQSAKYRAAVERIRDDEALHLKRHRETVDQLLALSRFLFKSPMPDAERQEADLLIELELRTLENVEALIKETFADHRKALREALG